MNRKPHNVLNRIRSFIASESVGGLVLVAAALLALIVSNSPLAAWLSSALHARPELPLLGPWLGVRLTIHGWINDLLMAVFFLVVGLEIKRELLAGELASVKQAALPAAAAFGGMVVPALIYAAINRSDAVALRGWAIPTATDIAFALGVLMLLGSRVPPSLKVFLTAVAIIDDLGAIAVIAIFYTSGLSLPMLAAACACAASLFVLNRLRVVRLAAYLGVGLVMWLCVLKSGIHPTLAGVATALSIPLRDGRGGSPLQSTEHALHPWVVFGVLPIFAFANAGVSLQGVSIATMLQPVPMGIALGLVVGKAVGVFGAAWLMVKWAGASVPNGATWVQFFAVCVLCGIGFTMSLFIGSLAFDGLAAEFDSQLKLGVLGGSTLAAALGLSLMRVASRRRPQ
jgi:Na+:H+ antiporter, NhaA family